MAAVLAEQEVKVDRCAPGKLSPTISQQTDIKALAHSIQSVTACGLQRRGKANFALFRRRHMCDRIGAQDRNFGIGHTLRVKRRPLAGASVESSRFLADIALATSTIDFLNDPDKFDRPSSNAASCRHDLRSLDSFVPVHPEIEDAAGRFKVRRRRDAAKGNHASGRQLGQFLRCFSFGEFSHGVSLPRIPLRRNRRVDKIGSGVNSGLRHSSARTIGSRDTGIRP